MESVGPDHDWQRDTMGKNKRCVILWMYIAVGILMMMMDCLYVNS